MGYQMWCEAVRLAILATAWLLVFIFAVFDVPLCRDVKSSRRKWPVGQNFGLSLGLIALPRPQLRPRGFGLV